VPGLLDHPSLRKYSVKLWLTLEFMLSREGIEHIPAGKFIYSPLQKVRDLAAEASKHVVRDTPGVSREAVNFLSDAGGFVLREDTVYRKTLSEAIEDLQKIDLPSGSGKFVKGARETGEEFVNRVSRALGDTGSHHLLIEASGQVIIRNGPVVKQMLLKAAETGSGLITITRKNVADISARALDKTTRILSDKSGEVLEALAKNWDNIGPNTRKALDGIIELGPNGVRRVKKAYKKARRWRNGDVPFILGDGVTQVAGARILMLGNKNLDDAIEIYNKRNPNNPIAGAGEAAYKELFERFGIEETVGLVDTGQDVIQAGYRFINGVWEVTAPAIDNITKELPVQWLKLDGAGVGSMSKLTQILKQKQFSIEMIQKIYGDAYESLLKNPPQGPLGDLFRRHQREYGRAGHLPASQGQGLPRLIDDLVEKNGLEEEFLDYIIKSSDEIGGLVTRKTAKGVVKNIAKYTFFLAIRLVPYIIMAIFIAMAIYHRHKLHQNWQIIHNAAMPEGDDDSPASMLVRHCLKELGLEGDNSADTMKIVGDLVYRPNKLKQMAIQSSVGCPKQKKSHGEYDDFRISNLSTLTYRNAIMGLIDTDYSSARVFSPGGSWSSKGSVTIGDALEYVPVDIPIIDLKSVVGDIPTRPSNWMSSAPDAIEKWLAPSTFIMSGGVTHPESNPDESQYEDLGKPSADKSVAIHETGHSLPTSRGDLANDIALFTDNLIEEMVPLWTQSATEDLSSSKAVFQYTPLDSESNADIVCSAEKLKAILALSWYMQQIGMDAVSLEEDVQIVGSTALFLYAHKYSWLIKRVDGPGLFALLRKTDSGIKGTVWDYFASFARMSIFFGWMSHDLSVGVTAADARGVQTNNFGTITAYVTGIAENNLAFINDYDLVISKSLSEYMDKVLEEARNDLDEVLSNPTEVKKFEAASDKKLESGGQPDENNCSDPDLSAAERRKCLEGWK
jgi:hypothetical protein